MSQENVDLIAGMADAFNSGDLERFTQYYDPDLVVESDAGPFLGTALEEAWERNTEWEPEEIVDLGNDRVLARWHRRGRGPASDVVPERRYTVIYKIRDGRIVTSDSSTTTRKPSGLPGYGSSLWRPPRRFARPS